jgi:hypothetical protein
LVGAGALEATRRPERLFMALVAAADIVAVAGLIVLLVDHNLAVQAAAPHMPARLRGFGQNPNTASMLFAVALPIAVGLVVTTRSVWMRAAAGMSCLLLYGSIVLSDSRGALIAAAGGTVVFLALTTRRLSRLVPVEAVAIVFFLATFQLAGHRTSLATATVAVPTTPIPGHVGSAKPGAPAGSQSTPGTGPSTTPPASRVEVGIRQSLPTSEIPVPFVPRQDEIGYPLLYTYKPILGYGSGRVFAWLTAIRTGLQRPTLGYGFGTEPIVFIDRFYIFQGEYTENSFVGMFLQLGIIGTLLLLLPFVLVGRAGLLARRRSTERTTSITAAAAGVAAAGFVVAFFQSYLYSVGNVATLTFWVCAVIAITSLAASPENA